MAARTPWTIVGLVLVAAACGHSDDDDPVAETTTSLGGTTLDGGATSAGTTMSPVETSASDDAADSETSSGALDGGTTGDGTEESEGSTGMPADVPDNAYCDPIADWDAPWVLLEDDLLELVNAQRAMGGDCGRTGSFGPAPPLTMNPALRCAARVHSLDMDARAYFDHVDPDGVGPPDRFDAAGYSWSTWGENIATGQPSAAEAMSWWMNSPPHCANILDPGFAEMGAGYHPGGQYGHLWTQTFGRQ